MVSSLLAPLVWTQLWQVTSLVALVLLVNRWTAKRRPHLSHLLWAVVLLKCLTPPLVAAPWSVFGWVGSSLDASSHRAAMTSSLAASDGYWAMTSTTRSATATETTARQDSIATAMPSNPVAGWTWQGLGIFVWLSTAIMLLFLLAVRCVRGLRLVHQMRLDANPDLERVVHDLATRLQIKPRVRVIVTRCNVGPAVVGLIRPTIILPELLVAGRHPSELQAVLAHELIHVRRGDLWMGAMQWIAQATWWFHPLVWIGNRLMSRDAERCCDEEVIAELEYAPAEYARMLLDVLSRKQELTPMPMFPGVRPVDVTSQRLERIMQMRQGSLRRTPRAYWLLAGAIALMVLPASWMRLSAQENVSKPNEVAIDPQDIEIVRTAYSQSADESAVEPIYPKTYRLDQVLPRLDEAGITVQGLIALLKMDGGLLGQINGPPPAGPEPQFAFFEATNSLIVSHHRDGHEQIANKLQLITQFGLHQISIETRVISVDAESTKLLSIPWQTFEDSDSQASAGARMKIDHSLPPKDRKAVSSGAHTVQRHLPVLFATTSPEQAKVLIQKAQADSRTNILQAPKVTLFNGQTAQVADIVQKPFVVGFDNSAGMKEEPKAKIRLVEEGWRLTLRAIQLEDSIWLDCTSDFSSLRDVESCVLPIQHQGKPLELQIPEVARSQMHVRLAIEDSHSLLLYGLGVGEQKDESLIVMITPRKIRESTKRAWGTTKTRETYKRHPISGGVVDRTEDARTPPSDKEVMRALASLKPANDLIRDEAESRDFRIVKEKIADYVDPPRHYPLVGPAQLHHAHYKCTVYFGDGEAPTRHAADHDTTEVLYVDATHLIRMRPEGKKPWQANEQTPPAHRSQSTRR